MPTAKTKRTQNRRLNREQAFKVSGWLDKNWHNAQRMTKTGAARRCSTDLGFEVTTFSIEDIAKATGRKFNGASSDATKLIGQLKQGAALIATALDGMEKLLGAK
jgi:hypothetical protein